jgi:hypothetical protein
MGIETTHLKDLEIGTRLKGVISKREYKLMGKADYLPDVILEVVASDSGDIGKSVLSDGDNMVAASEEDWECGILYYVI